jgi:hypothetical protein
MEKYCDPNKKKEVTNQASQDYLSQEANMFEPPEDQTYDGHLTIIADQRKMIKAEELLRTRSPLDEMKINTQHRGR